MSIPLDQARGRSAKDSSDLVMHCVRLWGYPATKTGRRLEPAGRSPEFWRVLYMDEVLPDVSVENSLAFSRTVLRCDSGRFARYGMRTSSRTRSALAQASVADDLAQ